MKFSASELVKRSASQLLYKELKKIQWAKTPRQFQGNQFAEEIVLKEHGSSEKRGIISIGEHALFFCVDMVKDNKLIEIKMVEDEDNYEEWYLQSSILQSTFYATLATKVKVLDTPKFRQKEGYAKEYMLVPEDFVFELWFGENQKYQVFPDENLYNHYINKLEIIAKGVESANWEEARLFDFKYKFKEFKIFNPKFIRIA